MLSKKMTVSLMSLITILGLAFVAPSAMAQVKVTVTGLTSVPHGGTTETVEATTVDIVIETDKATAALAASDFKPIAFDQDNNVLYVDATVDEPVSVASVALNTAMTNTGMKKYYTLTVTAAAVTAAAAADNLPLRVVVTIPAIGPSDPSDDTANSAVIFRTITITEISDTSDLPKVVSIQRLRDGSQSVVAAFQEERIKPDSFNVRFVLSKAHSKYDAGKTPDQNANLLIEVEKGTASNLVVGQKFAWHGGMSTDTPPAPIPAQAIRPHPIEGMYEHDGTADPIYGPLAGVPAGVAGSGNVPMPNSDDNMYSQYRVTITPHQRPADFTIKIRVKEFDDGNSPVKRTYLPPGFGESVNLPNGRDILSIPVEGNPRRLTAGYKVVLPKELRIPAGGSLVIVQNYAGSEVVVPAGSKKDPPKDTERTPAQMLYNVHEASNLPNLATQFVGGVVLDLESPKTELVISEVMWGEDVSLDPSSNSQYIELHNPSGDDYVTADDAPHTLGNEATTLVFYAPNEFRDAMVKDLTATLPDGTPVADRIGTLDATGAGWPLIGKGQSGRSGTTATGTAGERGAFVPVVEIVSMYRMLGEDGQMAASWMSSQGPKSANFDPLAIGERHGTPGAATEATDTPADAATEAKAKADAAAAAAKKTASTGTYPMAGQGKVYISEVMVAGGGVLPQWIEIANGDLSTEYNLSGWTLTVANAAADADVSVGASATFTIADGTTIDPRGQQNTPSTILVVTEAGRNNVDGSGQVINLMKDNEVDLILAGVATRKYTLLSDMAFLITLAPPEPAATKAPAGETTAAKATRMAAETKAKAVRKAATDMVGNLGADGGAAWALPMSEDGRSSLIRKHVQVNIGAAEPEDGTMAENWVLASDTSFAQATHIRAASYYGAQNDEGTPGFRAGGALPVELSHFRPARQDTGTVVITWSTQSELNNAGFFIKRSNQKDGEFQVINAAMVPGAGTTSEKQFYTYTDTTAQPNVVYYYQIEDVSLDGNRQTLTRGIRLKGHIGAAGKLTSTWGELKTSNE